MYGGAAEMAIAGLLAIVVCSFPVVQAVIGALVLRAIAGGGGSLEKTRPKVRDAHLLKLMGCLLVKSITSVVVFIAVGVFLLSDGGVGLSGYGAAIGLCIAWLTSAAFSAYLYGLALSALLGIEGKDRSFALRTSTLLEPFIVFFIGLSVMSVMMAFY